MVIQRQLDNPNGFELKLLEAREIVRDIVKNPKPEEIPTDANQVQQVLAAVNLIGRGALKIADSSRRSDLVTENHISLRNRCSLSKVLPQYGRYGA